MLKVFDSSLGELRDFTPNKNGLVSMYVCGPTVYGPPHLGHGRFSLVFDVMRRYLEWSGFEVVYVSNITDIDDKIINKANETGVEWAEVAERYELVWNDAMKALGVKAPTHTPHATDYVEKMVGFIEGLIEHGNAYETSDGIYFRSSNISDYGLLARQSIDSLMSGARVEVLEEKENSIDFVLWKKSKPNEPSWDSPWGPGRPGWHTECVVMSVELLGSTFDIHGGGQDLCFPHHENERAQARACDYGFANYWIHNGFVEVEGEKMSKSLNNFTTLTDLIERVDPRSYRMLCLQSHYRSPLEVTESTTSSATSALERIDTALTRCSKQLGEAAHTETPEISIENEFISHMNNDFDTPKAISVIFGAVTELNKSLDANDNEKSSNLSFTIRRLLSAVGIVPKEEKEVPPEIEQLCVERDNARKNKNWVESDRIRSLLIDLGWVVEDTPNGTIVR